MTIEQPKDKHLEHVGATLQEGAVTPEQKMSEDEQQTIQENACRERFIQDWVVSSTLTQEQKVFVAGYINKTPGAWREYNGTDFKVVEARIDGNHWKVSFGLYFENYEAQRVDVVIPLSEE